MSITRIERRLARRRLKRLMPRAFAEAKASLANGVDNTIEHLSPMGAVFVPQLRLERLDGFHLYRTEEGQFHADFYLRDMPDYFPNVIGTPKEMPLESEAEAESWAVTQLVGIILAERQAGQGTPPSPDRIPFEVFDHTMFVPSQIVDEMSRKGPVSVVEASWVIENTYRDMGNEVTVEKLCALPQAQLIAFYMSVSSLLIAGSPRYPLRWPIPG